jgi:hypothetical protein
MDFGINLFRVQRHQVVQLAIRQLDRDATEQQLSRGLIGPVNLTFCSRRSTWLLSLHRTPLEAFQGTAEAAGLMRCRLNLRTDSHRRPDQVVEVSGRSVAANDQLPSSFFLGHDEMFAVDRSTIAAIRRQF